MCADNIPNKCIEEAFAFALFKALERSDTSGVVQEAAGIERTTIDGTFNLNAVAKQVLWDLRDRLKPV